MKISAVIFSGGQGTRMKEETEFRPKLMATVGGTPILPALKNVRAAKLGIRLPPWQDAIKRYMSTLP